MSNIVCRLVTSARGSSTSAQFLESEENSIYHQILKNNMDEDSFIYSGPEQIKMMVESDQKLAYFGSKAATKFFASSYKCKV